MSEGTGSCPHIRDGAWTEWAAKIDRQAALEWSRHWRSDYWCKPPHWFQELVGDYIWGTRWQR